MNKPNFNITEDYYKRNFEKIKQELQSYVDVMIEVCGENSEEHQETAKIQEKILNGNFEELGTYLSDMYYAVDGKPEKYCPEQNVFIELLADLPKETT